MRAIGLFAAVLLAAGTGGETLTVTKNSTGEHNGYNYELWCDTGTATVGMTLGEGGAFDCSWENAGNILFRTGKKLGSKQTHAEMGDITVEYACDYNPKKSSYLCVYGWTEDPMIEFYVVESWGEWRPPGSASKGKIEVDGGTYDVYQTTRTNMPSIQGTKTFEQYWSVRTTKNTEGTVSLSEHFKAWEELGMELGKMYEVSMCIEGYNDSGEASGTANMYKHRLLINGTEIGEDIGEELAVPETTATGGTTADVTENENGEPPYSTTAQKWLPYAFIGAGALLVAGGIIAAVVLRRRKPRS